jgi:hypothetical protein
MLTADDFNFVPIQVAVRVTGVARERIAALARHGIINSGTFEGIDEMVSLPSLRAALSAGYETAVTRSINHDQVFEFDGVEYVTPPGAATLLGASVGFVDDLIKRGKMNDTLIGARRFIRYEEVADCQTEMMVHQRELKAKEKLFADVEKTQRKLADLLAKAGLREALDETPAPT